MKLKQILYIPYIWGPFFKQINIHKECIKLIKSDSEDICNFTKAFFFFLFIKES